MTNGARNPIGTVGANPFARLTRGCACRCSLWWTHSQRRSNRSSRRNHDRDYPGFVIDPVNPNELGRPIGAAAANLSPVRGTSRRISTISPPGSGPFANARGPRSRERQGRCAPLTPCSPDQVSPGPSPARSARRLRALLFNRLVYCQRRWDSNLSAPVGFVTYRSQLPGLPWMPADTTTASSAP
jgi:hypothetical protein